MRALRIIPERTRIYIYRAVIETSISVFLVTQIDDWVQYCLMRHPKMARFRKILRTRNVVERNEQPRRYGKQVLMARHMIIGEADDGITSDEVNRTLIVHGLGGDIPAESVFEDDAWPGERVQMADADVLYKVFSRFGELLHQTVRKRRAKIWERPRLERERALYTEVEEAGSQHFLDTSWALLTMSTLEAAAAAVAASPLEVVPEVVGRDGSIIEPAKMLHIDKYSQINSQQAKGAMRSVLKKHEWSDTEAEVMVPLTWIRMTADQHGFRVWHNCIEIFFIHVVRMHAAVVRVRLKTIRNL